MPRLIFKCPYIKGKSKRAPVHLKNMVNYIATRDGAERIDPGNKNLPATENQKELIEHLMREFPLSRGLFEYQDFVQTPTQGNASEFITRALEDNLNQIAKRENYLEYIAKRPRAVRMGAHGLFNGSEDSIVLSQVAEEIAQHPGNIWLPIISLRREDAERLGYDNAENWRSLLSSNAMEIAKAMKIPWRISDGMLLFTTKGIIHTCIWCATRLIRPKDFLPARESKTLNRCWQSKFFVRS